MYYIYSILLQELVWFSNIYHSHFLLTESTLCSKVSDESYNNITAIMTSQCEWYERYYFPSVVIYANFTIHIICVMSWHDIHDTPLTSLYVACKAEGGSLVLGHLVNIIGEDKSGSLLFWPNATTISHHLVDSLPPPCDPSQFSCNSSPLDCCSCLLPSFTPSSSISSLKSVNKAIPFKKCIKLMWHHWIHLNLSSVFSMTKH